MQKNDFKIAFVFENLHSIGGANLVNRKLIEIFPKADIYSLYGNKKFVGENFFDNEVKFSFLNKLPFSKKLYTYHLPLWPLAVESFDLSKYDLVISSSYAVTKGSITSEHCLHISYVHTPMRYLWDLKNMYGKYRFFKAPFLNFLRIWDVMATDRIDKLLVISDFVNLRCKKYWGRNADAVINPPVDLYSGEIIDYKKRKEYFVSGAPFGENKGGDFLIECAKHFGFNLKIIGKSRGYRRLKRLARGSKNIEFLGRVSDEVKWEVLSNSKGFIATGIEDFGIFPIESISCGTPVLALESGGYLETVTKSVNGVFYRENTLKEFKKGLDRFLKTKWDINLMRDSVKHYSSDRFKKEVEDFVRKSI